jgi:hypothetical protein
MSDYIFPDEPHQIGKLGDIVVRNSKTGKYEWVPDNRIDCPSCELHKEIIMDIQEQLEG